MVYFSYISFLTFDTQPGGWTNPLEKNSQIGSLLYGSGWTKKCLKPPPIVSMLLFHDWLSFQQPFFVPPPFNFSETGRDAAKPKICHPDLAWALRQRPGDSLGWKQQVNQEKLWVHEFHWRCHTKKEQRCLTTPILIFQMLSLCFLGGRLRFVSGGTRLNGSLSAQVIPEAA